MATWNVNGFQFTLHKSDHPPFHVHIRYDGRLVGKYDLENDRWMEGPYYASDQAQKALRKWRANQAL